MVAEAVGRGRQPAKRAGDKHGVGDAGHPCKNPAPLATKRVVRRRVRNVRAARGGCWLPSRGSGRGTEILTSLAGGTGSSRRSRPAPG